jgi:hypothetical protein
MRRTPLIADALGSRYGLTVTVRALVYFGCIFALGFVLGACRMTWLVPLVGERAAELIEIPIMLVGIFGCARWLVRRFPAKRRIDHLGSGLLALAVMLVFEFTVVLLLRGLSVSDYLATRDVISGAVYVVALALFAVMPWLIARS